MRSHIRFSFLWGYDIVVYRKGKSFNRIVMIGRVMIGEFETVQGIVIVKLEKPGHLVGSYM